MCCPARARPPVPQLELGQPPAGVKVKVGEPVIRCSLTPGRATAGPGWAVLCAISRMPGVQAETSKQAERLGRPSAGSLPAAGAVGRRAGGRGYLGRLVLDEAPAGQLRQRGPQDGDGVGDGVRSGGVLGPEQNRQRLSGAGLAVVEKGPQRMQPKPSLNVGAAYAPNLIQKHGAGVRLTGSR